MGRKKKLINYPIGNAVLPLSPAPWPRPLGAESAAVALNHFHDILIARINSKNSLSHFHWVMNRKKKKKRRHHEKHYLLLLLFKK